MKLRLLMTQECDRNCPGCCNKDWDLENLPKFRCGEVQNYSSIIITGGEPLLFGEELLNNITWFKSSTKAPVIVYTAMLRRIELFQRVLSTCDGITLTLHENYDVEDFLRLNGELLKGDFHFKSLRLNIFKGIEIPKDTNLTLWKIKDNIEWIENCPLPSDEVFKRL